MGRGGENAQRYVVLFQSPPALGLENDCEHSIHTLKLNPRAPGQCSTSTVGVESIQIIPTTRMIQYLCAICPRYLLLAAGSANKCYKNSLQSPGPKVSGDRHNAPLLGYSFVISTPALARLVCRAKKEKEKKKKRRRTPKQNKKDPKLTSLVNCVRRADIWTNPFSPGTPSQTDTPIIIAVRSPRVDASCASREALIGLHNFYLISQRAVISPRFESYWGSGNRSDLFALITGEGWRMAIQVLFISQISSRSPTHRLGRAWM